MKAVMFLCVAACASVATAIPPLYGMAGGAGGAGGAAGVPFIPSASMIQAFIPTPEQIAALNALHTTPAPVVLSTIPPVGPTSAPTMPPAVANLVNKYFKAAAAFMPPSSGPGV